MKKQINPTIKAHLIRSAFYVRLLLAVCVIPFALAQSRSRGTAKQSVTKQSAGQLMPVSPFAALPADAASSALLAPPGKRPVQIDRKPLQPSGVSSVLWYNGDFNGVNVLANEDNTALGSGQFASVYDDFNVPSGGWTLTAVFSDNLSSTTITGALWEIRQGISEGNGGTLIASGMTMTPVVTPTGRSGFGFTEYMIEVIGLNVSLAPGTYWLNVTPIGNLSGRSVDSTTSGTNCVGTPCGNNMNAFFNSNFFGANFTSTSNEGQPTDFSMGVEGTTGGGGTPSPTPTATVPACLVVNGGFETGSLPPWTNTGDTSFTGVDGNPHSGNFALFSGPVSSDGFVDQVIPTVAGQAYDVTFWLENDDDSGDNRFGASFGSVTLVPEGVQSFFGYTQFTFTNVVPGANADLHFIFYNVPSFFYLDDVCVTPSGGGTPTPTPTPTATGTPTCTPGPLWYNGDFNGVNGLANEMNTSIGSGEYSRVYDDFVVTDCGGWNITSVFSDNLLNTNVTGATWEIRTGEIGRASCRER